MEFIPLHSAPEFMTECAELLNDEWKRSLTARLHSLEKSQETFPICLLLLQKNGGGKQDVIGHTRLSDVRGLPTKSCLIESVVVRKVDRGKGYGKILMEKSEQFAARKGYKMMYLTTHDKQDFYSHIGYQFCAPIVSMGSSIMPEGLAQKLLGNMSLEENGSSSKNEVISPRTNQKECDEHASSTPPTKIPPPPPPPNAPFHSNHPSLQAPPPPHAVTPTRPLPNTQPHSSHPPSLQAPPQTQPIPPPPPLPTAHPSVHAPPPPPPVPQGPPLPDARAMSVPQAPPPPGITTPLSQGPSGDKNVVRWDPSKVSWMKKDISTASST